ncbi:SAF domain-containing protein [Streptomyces sp. NPDC058595]|uniref:SAF domain-containing protein n=1 Tax=Streptomyces sp. NPDC058595 TaxID=3346550 RepID=UPI00364CD120
MSSAPLAPLPERAAQQPDLDISSGAGKPSRRWSPFILCVLLALVGALVGSVVVTRAGDRTSVLAVARDVPAGQRITGADLVSVSFAKDPALSPVPAGQRASMVGRRAVADLREGSLLTRSQVTGGALGDDRQLVGVELKRGQVPRAALSAGDRVLAVILPSEGAPSGKRSTAEPEEPGIDAVVVSVGPADGTGAVTVNLAVGEGDGPVLAVKAAVKQVALVRQPRS